MSEDYCFVAMPFRSTSNPDRSTLDFDGIYREIIVPAVRQAGMRPFRADSERTGGIFHKPMFEKLAICEFCIADVSQANPNVYYELGVRHGLRPWATIVTYCEEGPLPLDIAPVLATPYPPDVLQDAEARARTITALVERLCLARTQQPDSPVYQLVAGLPTPALDHMRTEAVFDALQREEQFGEQIAEATQRGPEALRQLQLAWGSVELLSAQQVIALLLGLRSVESWEDIVQLHGSLPRGIAEIWLVREQYASALARLGRFQRAAEILTEMADRRPNAETLGLLGGVYKREWLSLVKAGASPARIRGSLQRACDAYLRGFHCDLRDPYPGVNAVMLLRVAGMRAELDSALPIVRYALQLRLKKDRPDFWDYASELLLAASNGERSTCDRILPCLLTLLLHPFEASTTIAGLKEALRHVPDLGEEARELLSESVTEIEERARELRRPTPW